jgi:hypothetical protein
LGCQQVSHVVPFRCGPLTVVDAAEALGQNHRGQVTF